MVVPLETRRFPFRTPVRLPLSRRDSAERAERALSTQQRSNEAAAEHPRRDIGIRWIADEVTDGAPHTAAADESIERLVEKDFGSATDLGREILPQRAFAGMRIV